MIRTQTVNLHPLSSSKPMLHPWSITESDLKRYPHFDSLISAAAAEQLAQDAARVATHSFYPFMLYSKRWTRFGHKGQTGPAKERPIRYAARRDAYIFSYYRHLLSIEYEAELSKANLGDSILAYRRIVEPNTSGGKCNIHFARDAFSAVTKLQNCCVLTLDISGFFESLDHDRLKTMWCRMLGADKLPPDHHQVFKAITQYSDVDKQEVYQRLGHFGVKSHAKNGSPIMGYLTKYEDIPKHLCNGKTFRESIAGEGISPSIIHQNKNKHGIPQGAPISDLLANLYLLDFDKAVAQAVSAIGGKYYRYSDDILIIAPISESEAQTLLKKIRSEIENHGAALKIKEEKSSLLAFHHDGKRQSCKLVAGNQGKNGLEYLGFRFDGRRIYIRDSTISGLRRKVARFARAEAISAVKRYPGKDTNFIKDRFNYEKLIERFGRVEDFDSNRHDYRTWTFWTYATRATKLLGKSGLGIYGQLKRHRELVRERVDHEIEKAVARQQKKHCQALPTVSL